MHTKNPKGYTKVELRQGTCKRGCSKWKAFHRISQDYCWMWDLILEKKKTSFFFFYKRNNGCPQRVGLMVKEVWTHNLLVVVQNPDGFSQEGTPCAHLVFALRGLLRLNTCMHPPLGVGHLRRRFLASCSRFSPLFPTRGAPIGGHRECLCVAVARRPCFMANICKAFWCVEKKKKVLMVLSPLE